MTSLVGFDCSSCASARDQSICCLLESFFFDASAYRRLKNSVLKWDLNVFVKAIHLIIKEGLKHSQITKVYRYQHAASK